jgi:hypothetical protein
MGDLEIYFPDNSALRFTDSGVEEGESMICDGCNTRQMAKGSLVTDQIALCAPCRGVDRLWDV